MIPAWDDLKSYPLPSAPMAQWAWEFLRRNIGYRQAWDQYKSTGTKPTRHDLVDKFGLTNLCDPDKDYEAVYFLVDFQEPALVPCIIWSNTPRFDKEGLNLGMDTVEFAQATQPQTPYEVVMKFDVRNDIDTQLDEATKQLKSFRKSFQDKNQELSPTSPHRDKFPIYLQLLDAETQCSVNSEAELFLRVAKVLAPNEDQASAADRFKKNLKVARYWRDTGYKHLVLVKYFNKEDVKEIKKYVTEHMDDMVALNKLPEK